MVNRILSVDEPTAGCLDPDLIHARKTYWLGTQYRYLRKLSLGHRGAKGGHLSFGSHKTLPMSAVGMTLLHAVSCNWD